MANGQKAGSWTVGNGVTFFKKEECKENVDHIILVKPLYSSLLDHPRVR